MLDRRLATQSPVWRRAHGPEPDRPGPLGWKWSLLTDRAGVPFGWATNGANRHDVILFEPILAAGNQRGLVADIETLHLDRGYDNGCIRNCVDEYRIGVLICAKKRPPGTAVFNLPVPLGMRWPVERTNSWLTNYGQMRRNTDRRIDLRLAQLALSIALILTIKLIDWRNRYSPTR